MDLLHALDGYYCEMQGEGGKMKPYFIVTKPISEQSYANFVDNFKSLARQGITYLQEIPGQEGAKHFAEVALS